MRRLPPSVSSHAAEAESSASSAIVVGGRLRRLAILAAMTVVVAARGVAAEIWVAPNGDDSAAGTKEAPLATPAMGLRKARELRRLADPTVKDGVVVVLRAGLYELDEPLWLRSEDSGSAMSPTVIAAANGERPVLSGGVALRRWSRVDDVPGLPVTARGNVWMADVPRTDGRVLLIRELWVRGHKATRARTPNDPKMDRLAGWDRHAERAIVASASVPYLGAIDGVEMVVEQQWEIAILRLRSVERTSDQARLAFAAPESALEFQHPWPQPILPPKGGGAYFLTNAIEFLDSPGEWYEDVSRGRVYYWPRAGEDLTRDEVVVPRLETLVKVSGTLDHPVEHVAFRGVTFAYAAWNEPGRTGHVPLQAAMPMVEAYKLAKPGTPDKRGLENQAWITRAPAAVVVDAASSATFERCRFEHFGSSALDLRRGVDGATIEGCVFRDIGANGIQLGSFQEGGVETHVPYRPADPREVCRQVRIANNVLRDTANTDWGGVAIISGYASGVAIEHNDIADTSYTGISVGWGWTPTETVSRSNRIHANRVVRAATRVCDTAGIYTLSAQPGTSVTENVVDAITMSPYVDRPDHWFYVYADEGTAGVTIRDNWCPAEKFLRNANGPGNVWTNNGPTVADAIKQNAGVEPSFRGLLSASDGD